MESEGSPRTFTEPEVAALAGVTVRQLGHWRRVLRIVRASVADPSRRQSGRRGGIRKPSLYSEADLLRVRFLRALLAAGATVADLTTFVRNNGPAFDDHPYMKPPDDQFRAIIAAQKNGWLRDKAVFNFPRSGGRFLSIELDQFLDPKNQTFAFSGKARDGKSLYLDEFGALYRGAFFEATGRQFSEGDEITPEILAKANASWADLRSRFTKPKNVVSTRTETVTYTGPEAWRQMGLFLEENPMFGRVIKPDEEQKEKAEGAATPTAREDKPESVTPPASKPKGSTPNPPLSLRRLAKVAGVKDGKQRPRKRTRQGVTHAKHPSHART